MKGSAGLKWVSLRGESRDVVSASMRVLTPKTDSGRGFATEAATATTLALLAVSCERSQRPHPAEQQNGGPRCVS